LASAEASRVASRRQPELTCSGCVTMPPMDAASPGALKDFYRRYNRACNEHRFAELEAFVADEVQVDGERRGLPGYIAALEAVGRAFPDYRWDLQHLLVDGPHIAAHFIDTGTHLGSFLDIPATGRTVTVQEFAIYRVEANKIVEVWGTADNLRLVEQLR
jgi:predicted ester cyclase